MKTDLKESERFELVCRKCSMDQCEGGDDHQNSNCWPAEESETNTLISLFVLTPGFKSGN
jgi:hypothetical protein